MRVALISLGFVVTSAASAVAGPVSVPSLPALPVSTISSVRPTTPTIAPPPVMPSAAAFLAAARKK